MIGYDPQEEIEMARVALVQERGVCGLNDL
jgi:hypothetical protein